MEPRIYIIANKEQELAVLGSLETEGFKWVDNDRPQEWLPSKEIFSEFGFSFPYTIVAYKDKTITWSYSFEYPKGSAVFDGRKEDKMTEKYKVTKKFMDKLVEWRDKYSLEPNLTYRSTFVSGGDISNLPRVVDNWWLEDKNPMERNRRLIAIISWLNGDDSVFEVEKPHKFIIRSEKPNWDGDYWYVLFKGGMADTTTCLANAAVFGTYAGAQEWANSHQVVIEVD